MKTITTTILAAMAGGLFACSSGGTGDGGTTTTGAATTGTTTGAATTGGTTSAVTTGGTTGAVTTGGTSAGTTGGTTGFPTAPSLGAEIDRMGRPAINTALTAPFGSATFADGGVLAEPAAKDLYNADSNLGDWQMNWPVPFAHSLPVYDALDAICGNQAGAKLPDAGPTAYGALAFALADDELYVDTSLATCQQYLAVELAFLGGIADFDCGGRTPLENTIDTTYSALAIGMPSGVTNGVTSDADHTASITVFPFLSTPN
jgi:hypothetical protein